MSFPGMHTASRSYFCVCSIILEVFWVHSGVVFSLWFLMACDHYEQYICGHMCTGGFFFKLKKISKNSYLGIALLCLCELRYGQFLIWPVIFQYQSICNSLFQFEKHFLALSSSTHSLCASVVSTPDSGLPDEDKT